MSSNIYTGPIERRACALQIGHGEDMDDFEGEMDDVCIILVDVFNEMDDVCIILVDVFN